MDIEIVASRASEDGIVFYVSADGSQTGISRRGLLRLSGYETTSADLFGKSKLLADMRDGVVRNSIPECLKPFWGKLLCQSLKGVDGAEIIESSAAVAIIEFRAFEQHNAIAKESYRKFAKLGFDTWVKKTVGFASEPTANSQLLEMLQMMHAELKTVSAKVTKWDRIEGISATVYPGLSLLNDSLSQDSAQKSLPSRTLYTIEDWLQIKGVVLDKRTFWQFVRLASDTYLSLTGERPKIKYAKDSKGKYQKKANGYRLVDFNVLETAWSSLTESNSK